MIWQTLPTWAKSEGISRERARQLLPRIPADRKDFTAAGWIIKKGTPKPYGGKGGRPRKPKSSE